MATLVERALARLPPSSKGVRNVRPSEKMKATAELLRKGRDALDTVEIPYLGGVGGLLMGESPELIGEMAYGRRPYRGSGTAAQLDKRLVDVAGLPLPYAGAGALGRAALKRALTVEGLREAAPRVGTSTSRREFLKRGGALAAAGTAAAAVPGVAKKLLTEAAPALAQDVGRVAATSTGRAMTGALAREAIQKGLAKGWGKARDALEPTDWFKSEFNREFWEETFENLAGRYSEEELEVIGHFSQTLTRNNDYGDWSDALTNHLQELPEKYQKSIREVGEQMLRRSDEYYKALRKLEDAGIDPYDSVEAKELTAKFKEMRSKSKEFWQNLENPEAEFLDMLLGKKPAKHLDAAPEEAIELINEIGGMFGYPEVD